MVVTLVPGQLDGLISTTPLPYTSAPLRLVWIDILLFFSNIAYLPNLFLPIEPWPSGALDELYPSKENLLAIGVHVLLAVLQLVFLISLPFAVLFPVASVALYVSAFLLLNQAACKVLNGSNGGVLISKTDLSQFPKHHNERWIFLNGVAVGKHWLQSNIDRISLTFGREVLGVHNPTAGIIFDVIQCLIQRGFSYATQDVRDCYEQVKKSLCNDKYTTIILILHSQGGIEGGLVLDWLLGDVPSDMMQKLEVYTFANAASHFNNPYEGSSAELSISRISSLPCKQQAVSPTSSIALRQAPRRTRRKSTLYIEHYANTEDFVARWGILHYTHTQAQPGPLSGRPVANKYMGRVLKRSGSGHQFNQHYMDNMFPLDAERGWGARDTNAFMESEIQLSQENEERSGMGRSAETGSTRAAICRETLEQCILNGGLEAAGTMTVRVKDVSRLWGYRNGRTPGTSLTVRP